MIYYGGLRIETCFDPGRTGLRGRSVPGSLRAGAGLSQRPEIQSAITVIDNSTGYVVALAGGIGEKDSKPLV